MIDHPIISEVTYYLFLQVPAGSAPPAPGHNFPPTQAQVGTVENHYYSSFLFQPAAVPFFNPSQYQNGNISAPPGLPDQGNQVQTLVCQLL